MTFEEYWKARCEKNPALANRDVVKLKTSGIKAMIKQAHEKGFEHCTETRKQLMENIQNGKNPFDGIFNKRK